MSGDPETSAILANWNGAEHLRVALPSLRTQTAPPAEILVVDNGSVDDSEEVTALNGATWIGLRVNKGLSFALNEGARRAKGDYLIFLNNDMRFASDFVTAIVDPLTKDRLVFATDARQMNWDGTGEIHLATRLRRRGFVDSYLRPGFLPLIDFVQESVSHPVFELQACSAAMAVRREQFLQLGGFDERLLVGWEDTEICWRAWLKGWGSVYVPRALCWHRVGASVSDNENARGARRRATILGRLLFATKHLPIPLVMNAWLISVLGVARDVLTGRVGDSLSRLSVLMEIARQLPSVVRERLRLYRESGVTPAQQLAHVCAQTEVWVPRLNANE